MAKFEKHQLVSLQGRVVNVEEGAPCGYLIEFLPLVSPKKHTRAWVSADVLTPAPAPVTVRCDAGCDHPLTDLPRLQERAKALGITGYDDIALALFAGICVALKNNGVTAEQFVEGL